ncbi:MAG: CooT family nickel-binding protein [Clostridiales bacterium]|jgi:predicted RNA-binding protein|nr:CooT family nickel-binding protein [Clostridiales bacterium]
MCEANVYWRDEAGDEVLFFENVDLLTPEGDKLILRDIFGRSKIVTARIETMQLTEHRIVITRGAAAEVYDKAH